MTTLKLLKRDIKLGIIERLLPYLIGSNESPLFFAFFKSLASISARVSNVSVSLFFVFFAVFAGAALALASFLGLPIVYFSLLNNFVFIYFLPFSFFGIQR